MLVFIKDPLFTETSKSSWTIAMLFSIYKPSNKLIPVAKDDSSETVELVLWKLTLFKIARIHIELFTTITSFL